MSNDLIALKGTPPLTGASSPTSMLILGLGAALLAFLAAQAVMGGRK